MKIQEQTKTKKIVLVIGLLALMLIGVVLAYIYFSTNNLSSKPDESNNTPSNISDTDREQSKDLQNNPEKKNEAPNTDHPAQPAVSSESGKKQVQMVASTDQSGDTVFIRGGVNYPVVGGSCYAQLAGPSGQSIRKDSTILQNPASADCKTIPISNNDLAPGKWTFMLHYTSDDYEGVSDEVSFTL